ncbi:hypothetical protein CVT24_009648 [Panaeolus cyanescens]|uniref:VOC domain-containing protein n=1 Tax=Panaeolus cyanescens TaxID=181874 RepID=A0A409Y9Z6_9AGAR|nr:hypothetical protein CVT24_009648 [Panaeolus cyanescens]
MSMFHVRIHVRNLEESKAFYQEVLAPARIVPFFNRPDGTAVAFHMSNPKRPSTLWLVDVGAPLLSDIDSDSQSTMIHLGSTKAKRASTDSSAETEDESEPLLKDDDAAEKALPAIPSLDKAEMTRNAITGGVYISLDMGGKWVIDNCYKAAIDAGATCVLPPDRRNGECHYSAAFKDLDGHTVELYCNTHPILLGKNGERIAHSIVISFIILVLVLAAKAKRESADSSAGTEDEKEPLLEDVDAAEKGLPPTPQEKAAIHAITGGVYIGLDVGAKWIIDKVLQSRNPQGRVRVHNTRDGRAFYQTVLAPLARIVPAFSGPDRSVSSDDISAPLLSISDSEVSTKNSFSSTEAKCASADTSTGTASECQPSLKEESNVAEKGPQHEKPTKKISTEEVHIHLELVTSLSVEELDNSAIDAKVICVLPRRGSRRSRRNGGWHLNAAVKDLEGQIEELECNAIEMRKRLLFVFMGTFLIITFLWIFTAFALIIL